MPEPLSSRQHEAKIETSAAHWAARSCQLDDLTTTLTRPPRASSITELCRIGHFTPPTLISRASASTISTTLQGETEQLGVSHLARHHICCSGNGPLHQLPCCIPLCTAWPFPQLQPSPPPTLAILLSSSSMVRERAYHLPASTDLTWCACISRPCRPR